MKAYRLLLESAPTSRSTVSGVRRVAMLPFLNDEVLNSLRLKHVALKAIKQNS